MDRATLTVATWHNGPMLTKPIGTLDHALLTDNAGGYIVTPSTGPTQPLVTPNASLTSKARHVLSRAAITVVARSSGKEVFTRGGTGPLLTPKSPLIVG